MTASKYQPRDLVVEAAQVSPETFRDALGLVDANQLSAAGEDPSDRRRVYITFRTIPNASYTVTANDSDWIIRYNDGRLQAMTDAEFQRTYVKTGNAKRDVHNTVRGNVTGRVIQTGDWEGGIYI